ncbi:LamG-like jellyroll fold domain-containing protein [Bremerella sp. JC770]|uniref:LamG-like jellyroll fold domain-containing protein n=1 Tax=Bremerella sp. JC770 TaxID=3232137 RepID=UPI0034598F3A
MTDPMALQELQDLIEARRDEVVTDEQHFQLEQLLRQNAEARRYFIHYQVLCSELQTIYSDSDLRELAGELTHDTLLGNHEWQRTDCNPGVSLASADNYFDRPNVSHGAYRFRWVPTISVVAGMLLMMILGWQLTYFAFQETDHGPPVATLVAAMDAQWGIGNPLEIGTSLPAIPLELKRGLAELHFASGASVVLQGPVECVLESPSHVTLQRGRITAKVPLEAVGFTVRTEQATIVDLGTEFGVNSAGSGTTDVHVFRGQVALGASQGSTADHQLLGEGVAKRVVVGSAQFESIRSDELAFVRPREFEARVKALSNSPYHRWLVASYQLRREPALVLYYTWDSPVEDQKHVTNRAGATAGKLDGLLGSDTEPNTCPQWVSPGRWPQQRSLRFDASRQQVLRVPHSNELNITQAVTIAVWIRPNTALMPATATLASKCIESSSDARPNYELALVRGTDEPGGLHTIRFRAGSKTLTTPGMRIVPGQWMHVAITSNGSNSILYVNGQPVANGDGADFIPNQGDLLIGTAPQDPQQPIGTKNESFEGLVSEFMLARRMMSEKEIRAMWMTGTPESKIDLAETSADKGWDPK